MLDSLERPRTAPVRSSANDAILTFDEDGYIEAANPIAEGLLQYGPNELLGRRVLSLVPHDCEERFLTAMDGESTNALATETAPLRTFRLVRKDGDCVAVQATIASVRFENRVLWTLVAQDNTPHEGAPPHLGRTDRLAAVGQAMAAIAHESRNSLQRIAAAIHQLKKRAADSGQLREVIARIECAADDLQRLHGTVLDFVKPRVLQAALTDIRDVVHTAWKAVTARPADPGAELYERNANVDTCCEIDAFAMRQVFRNIFENSLQACKGAGRVDVAYEVVTLHGAPALRIVIRDNGTGLTDEERKMLFVPFFTTKEHGLGLGMTIAKQVVEAHGGEIQIGEGPEAEIVIVLRKARR